MTSSDSGNASPAPTVSDRSAIKRAVFVAALGYFVDIYDLILFSVVRRASLLSLGVSERDLLSQGVLLINIQMLGMLLGGVFWGILGDKRGRLSVLYASIIMYSAANILNGFVVHVPMYALLRLIAGFGLAGELGAGVTLVSEMMDKRDRGWGTMIIATVGLFGAVVAALVADLIPWRGAYVLGGVLGIALLLLRVKVSESQMFRDAEKKLSRRGDFMLLFSPARFARYLSVIATALPIWFTVAVLITLCPEFARDFSMRELPSAGRAILWCYAGLSLGDLASGALSQALQSRRKVLGVFLVLTVFSTLAYFTLARESLFAFYATCFALGFSNGYWAVFMAIAAENFGTNLRATVATTVPNFVRGAVVPMTLGVQYAKDSLGLQRGAMTVFATVMLLAVLGVTALNESFGRDMNFVEE